MATETQKVIATDVSIEVAELMKEAYKLKEILNPKVKDEEYDPAIHLARRYDEVKTELASVQAERGVDGLVAWGLKFTSRLQEGRKTTDLDVLKGLMLGYGVPADVIKDWFEKASKSGAPFWVKEINLEK